MRPQSLFTAGCLLSTSLIAGCASLFGNHPKVPFTLKVPSSQTLKLATTAVGEQIYSCNEDKSAPNGYGWESKSSEATLSITHDKQASEPIAIHYEGPTWEGNDGSKVVGKVVASDPGPDYHAIPWLLISATSHSGGGIFSHTASILRTNTAGGRAPASGCDKMHKGQLVRVPYLAKYYFYD